MLREVSGGRGAKSLGPTWFCPAREDRRVTSDALQVLPLVDPIFPGLIPNGLELSMGCHSIDRFEWPQCLVSWIQKGGGRSGPKRGP